jgi:transposase
MAKPRKMYDAEFKRQTIALADASEKTDAAIEREMGLYQGAIRHWRAELLTHEDASFPGHGRLHSTDEELRRLRRENEILRQERDILKKAMVIFSAPPNRNTRS